MKRVGFALLILLINLSVSRGQNTLSDTLFTIDQQPYSSAQFLKLYLNNKLLSSNQSPLALDKALDLYIDFHLKVLDAKSNRLDTLKQNRREFNSFRNKLLKPYINPAHITKEKIEQAYERKQEFLSVQHILIKLKNEPTPGDTLKAFKKAIRIRDLLLKGESFPKVARTYSADLSVRSNKGKLGYFTVFQMIYKFESAAYKLKINEISQPVRTRFGYHLIQLLDRTPNPGKIRVAHLVISFPNKSSYRQKLEAKKKIDSLYSLLKQGINFTMLTKKYSTDHKTAPKGGVLPWFGAFEMDSHFEKTAFALPYNGAFSTPIKTPLGWHIIKRIDRKPNPSLQECYQDIISQIRKDGRCNLPEKTFIKSLRKKYKVKENKHLLSNFYSILDYAYADLTEPLITINNIPYSQEEFVKYLGLQSSKEINENFKDYINRIYDNFVNNCILAFHKERLLDNHPEIKELLEETLNGLLVFNITKKKIWIPAQKHPHKLQKFFQHRIAQYQLSHGKDITLDDIRETVMRDYQNTLTNNWLRQLHRKYKITVNRPMVQKLKNNYDLLSPRP